MTYWATKDGRGVWHVMFTDTLGEHRSICLAGSKEIALDTAFSLTAYRSIHP